MPCGWQVSWPSPGSVVSLGKIVIQHLFFAVHTSIVIHHPEVDRIFLFGRSLKGKGNPLEPIVSKTPHPSKEEGCRTPSDIFTHLYIQRQPSQTRCLLSELFRQASLVGCDVPNSSRTVGFQSIGVRVAPSDCRARKPHPQCGIAKPWNLGTLEPWKFGTLQLGTLRR